MTRFGTTVMLLELDATREKAGREDDADARDSISDIVTESDMVCVRAQLKWEDMKVKWANESVYVAEAGLAISGSMAGPDFRTTQAPKHHAIARVRFPVSELCFVRDDFCLSGFPHLAHSLWQIAERLFTVYAVSPPKSEAV